MYDQIIIDTKHSKTFISHPFGNSLDLRLVADLYFFLPMEHESVGKKNFFRLEAEKNFFTSILMGRSENRKQDYLF